MVQSKKCDLEIRYVTPTRTSTKNSLRPEILELQKQHAVDGWEIPELTTWDGAKTW